LVGPSGVGKSLALRQLATEAGVWMPQQSTLLPGTLLTNICFDADVDQASLNRALDLAQLAGFELDREVSSATLSGGEIQRVALARALYRLFTSQQKLLLLDEPTSQLDSLNSSRVIQGLRELVESGIQVVAISHSAQLIEQADQVVRIEH
jgi:ATP-binding cassette subfamily C protein CydD